MDATTGTAMANKAPLHVWVVGTASLLWSAFGCFDFLMTNIRDAAYLAQLPADMIDYLDGFPAWAVIAWAMGVGFALLGSMLLLIRSLYAAYAFAFSLLGLAGTQLYQFGEGTPPGMDTAASWGMTALIWLISVAVLVYALRMRARGVLR